MKEVLNKMTLTDIIPTLTLDELLLCLQAIELDPNFEIPLYIYKYVFNNRTAIKNHPELKAVLQKYTDLNLLRCLPEDYKQYHYYLQNYALDNYIKNMKVLIEDEYPYWDEKLYYYAINGADVNDGNLNCLKFLLKNNCPWNICKISRRIYGECITFIYPNITCIAAQCGNLECLTYLYNTGHTVNRHTFNKALDGLNEEEYYSKKQFKRFEKNIIACLQFLYEIHCEQNSILHTYLMIIGYNSIEALRYWHSLEHQWENKEKQMRYIICETIKLGNLQILIYLHKTTRYTYSCLQIETTLDKIIISNNAVIKYVYFNLIDRENLKGINLVLFRQIQSSHIEKSLKKENAKLKKELSELKKELSELKAIHPLNDIAES